MPTQKTQRGERERQRAHLGRKETPPHPWPFGSSYYMIFFLHLGLPYVYWASQECCLFYLRSSLPSSDLPLVYFCRLFPSDSVQPHRLQPTRLPNPWGFPGKSTGVGCHCLLHPCLLATAILDSFFLF